jgi:sugar lactone lactonase YvrE
MEALATGYGLLEAPFAADDGGVYFSDVLGGGLHRWHPDRGIETVVPKRRGIGGMCLHADGGVVVSGRDVAHVKDGESRTLFSLDGVAGFNDMGTDNEGRIYAGALRFMPFGGEEPVPGEIWRIDSAGEGTAVLDAITWANGIGFSPDGHTMYACDYASGELHALETASGERRVLARTPSGEADGLAVDVEGAIWVALGSGGALARYSPGGELQDTLEVPADFVSSVCFGGQDRRDVYVTTVGSLFRGRVDVPGLPVPLATV